MKTNLTYVPHEKIRKNPLNVFPVTPDDVEVLQAQINMEGLLTPLTLIGPYNDENGEFYRLISGECRWTAIGNLIKEGVWEGDIPCLIIDEPSMSDNMQTYRIISANTDNRDMGRVEKSKYILKMFICLKGAAKDGEIAEEDITNKIAKAMNKSQRTAQYYAQVFNNGSDKLIEHLTSDEIGIKDALKIIRGADSKEEQDELIEQVKQGKKVDDIIKKDSEEIKEESQKEEVPSTNSSLFQNIESILDKESWGDDFAADDESIDDEARLRDMENQITAKQTFSSENVPNYADSATQAVMRYCEKLLNKDDLTDDEYEVVNKMEEVVTRFL